MFWLTQKILKAFKNEGFVSAEIFGRQGIGKTTYALKVMREVYAHLGDPDPWSRALQFTFFDVRDVLPYLKEANQRRIRIPVILLDDAGIWLDKYEWRSEDMRNFAKLYKLMRTLVSGVLFTTPSENDLLKSIRDKSWYKVKIVRNGVNRDGKPLGMAKLYVYDIRKVKTRLESVVVERAIDEFSVHLRDDVYQRYQELRRSKGIEPQLDELINAFMNPKKKSEKEESPVS